MSPNIVAIIYIRWLYHHSHGETHSSEKVASCRCSVCRIISQSTIASIKRPNPSFPRTIKDCQSKRIINFRHYRGGSVISKIPCRILVIGARTIAINCVFVSASKNVMIKDRQEKRKEIQ